MTHVFIFNPAAGKKNSGTLLLKRAAAAFPDGDFELYTTKAPGDARAIAKSFADSGEAARLYACGGDGILNEVVNAAAGCAHIAVTNVPMGTGNDFLRMFGREGKLRFSDIAALRDGPESAYDLIDCNGKLGLDIVCAGIDARVAEEVHRDKRIPLVGKKLAYIISLVVNVLFKGLTRPMEVEMGPLRHSGPAAIVCVGNASYYGGGFCPLPEARPDDGVLDMLLIGDITLLQFARCVMKYAKGRYKECPELVRDWHGDSVRVSSQDEIVAVVDGEVLRAREFTIRLSDKRVNFFRPAGVELGHELAPRATQRSSL